MPCVDQALHDPIATRTAEPRRATPKASVSVIVPVKNEADFKKFLHNLWDLDVKTAPPPTPALAPQVTKSVQAKLKSHKLESNERIVFGLSEGFLRFESGQVHIGETLEGVRIGVSRSAESTGAQTELQLPIPHPD